MVKSYIPKRGDIVWINFDPAAGQEQKGKRPALILSLETFNKHFGMAVAAPITSRVRGHAFEVILNQPDKYPTISFFVELSKIYSVFSSNSQQNLF
jgi:mRNA-degrading endonuclease toxin of MazEF toxin-antitoxin module